MKYRLLQKIPAGILFSAKTLAGVLSVKESSAAVVASRYVRYGLLLRLKRDAYILAEKWINLSGDQRFSIANYLQVPSYISLMTALEYYNLTTQVQQSVIESIGIKRTASFEQGEMKFIYRKIDRKWYNNFTLKEGFFIASPEKAIADAVYLYSTGKYRFDINSVQWEKFDKVRMNNIFKQYPVKTKNSLKNLCSTLSYRNNLKWKS